MKYENLTDRISCSCFYSKVDDVKVIMGQNIEKVMERDSKIKDLDTK